ncbi:MAG: hypothetical protein QNK05_12490 [Myxococcota bacterium]|nr:hypothetical protein [Myxococcota bacterium]
MDDPSWVPALSAAAATLGGSLAARDYLRRRLTGQEDRFMALYGKDDWDACNMDMAFHFAKADDAFVKQTFRSRLEAHIAESDVAHRLFFEEARDDDAGFFLSGSSDLDALLPDRRGVRLILDEPGRIRVVWNHAQTDGVGLWEALRPTFDPSPPLVTYDDLPTPPAFLPELAGLPATFRRMSFRGNLRARCDESETRLIHEWPTAPIRVLKDELGANFNLVSAAAILEQVFERHPDLPYLVSGLLVFFPFLDARNRYGVITARIRRGPIPSIVRQLEMQSKRPMLRWGTVATQSYALSKLPEWAFQPTMEYFRRQVDVLISNLPVGSTPALMDGVPISISCHPFEMATPYYLLLVGTRDKLDVSVSSRFEEKPDFLSAPF